MVDLSLWVCVSVGVIPSVHHHLFSQAAHNILVVILDLILGIVNVHIVRPYREALLWRYNLNSMISEQKAIEVAKREDNNSV